MEKNEFDTIYHEHFSYISLLVAERILGEHGLAVFDVEELPTHGGSLRFFVRHAADTAKPVTLAVGRVRASERAAGLEGPEAYRSFADRAVEIKRALLDFMISAHRAGRKVVGYGAPAKGNTLELLRDPKELLPSRWTAARTCRGSCCRARAPHPLFRRDQGGAAGLRADPPLEPAGRDRGATGLHPRMGRCFVVPIPDVEVF